MLGLDLAQLLLGAQIDGAQSLALAPQPFEIIFNSRRVGQRGGAVATASALAPAQCHAASEISVATSALPAALRCGRGCGGQASGLGGPGFPRSANITAGGRDVLRQSRLVSACCF